MNAVTDRFISGFFINHETDIQHQMQKLGGLHQCNQNTL